MSWVQIPSAAPPYFHRLTSHPPCLRAVSYDTDMALNIYRRHRRDCKAGHPEDFRTSDLDERRKNWKRCECQIVASGTLARTFRRQTTGAWEWADAKRIVGEWEAANRWNAHQLPKVVQPEAARVQDSVQIRYANEAFLEKCRTRGIQPGRLAKYKTFTNQLGAFSDQHGYIFLDQFAVSDMDRFYASWTDGVRTKAKKLDRLKSFIKFCIKRKWIDEDIAEDLTPPPGSSITLPKSPFTDDELNRITAVRLKYFCCA